MEKKLQLVSYEQAKRLKKLGFDWGCSLIYASETDFHNQTTKGEIYEGGNYRNSYGRDCSAPTFALALKWARDEKNLFGYAFKTMYNRFCWSIYSDDRYGNFTGRGLNSHETAESALLDELLTILETT
jgi:hypothetical protein